MRRPINRAYLIIVAIDKDGNPADVPGIIVESESEKAEWEAALKRKEIRLQRKEEGF